MLLLLCPPIVQEQQLKRRRTRSNCRQMETEEQKQQQQQQRQQQQQQLCLQAVSEPTTNERISPVQITSIDGFFNRKRGRPPKNRFVEVYKSAQHSPQAIFTSFKLEKSDTNAVSCEAATATATAIIPSTASAPISTTTTATASSSTLTSMSTSTATATATSTATHINDLSHARKRALLPTAERASSAELLTSKYRRIKQQESQTTAFVPIATTTTTTTITTTTNTQELRKKTTNEISQAYQTHANFTETVAAEKISIVRAAGTFYPQKSNRNEESAQPAREEEEQPEDLSFKGKTPKDLSASGTSLGQAEEASLRFLQLKQLFSLYQQQQLLLPGYLQTLLPAAEATIDNATSASAAASAPTLPAFDMRAVIENAAKQKLILFNIAAAAAVASSAGASNSTSPPVNDDGVHRRREHNTPLGYLKFRFNEDCGFAQCGYRNHQSHFHCNRHDCHYSFCDKTRFVQHTARHDRLDTLMGDDFQQFRANMHCGRNDCSYATPDATVAATVAASRKSSHFHCRKCVYVCADTNKVVAHRRLHTKMEFIRSAGFRKVASHELCREDSSCSYALKHTHYHCLHCDFSVLSRAQLASHRHKSPATTSERSGERE